MKIVIKDEESKKVLAELEKKNDTESLRIKRMLAMPDLSRT